MTNGHDSIHSLTKQFDQEKIQNRVNKISNSLVNYTELIENF
jgi:hypothetical protein